MKQRFLNHISDEKADNMDNIQSWLDDDVYTCMNRKKDDVLAVMKAMRRNAEGNKDSAATMEGFFYSLILVNWLSPVFKKEGLEGPLGKMRESLQECWGRIASDNNSRTNVLINTLMEQVYSEKEDDNKVSLW